MSTMDRLKKCGIVPVVVVNSVEEAVPLAKALLAGGIFSAEVTFRTEAAPDAIEAIAKEVPEMIVGAGTVLNAEQAKLAIEKGAEFIVSPGTNLEVIKVAQEADVPVLPGTVTPTEIMAAIEAGCETVKFFPAGNYGGLKTIKALAGPFTKINFVPTGGVNLDNLEEYLSFDKIAFVGGTWMCKSDLIEAGKWDEITEISRQAVERLHEIRPETKD